MTTAAPAATLDDGTPPLQARAVAARIEVQLASLGKNGSRIDDGGCPRLWGVPPYKLAHTLGVRQWLVTWDCKRLEAKATNGDEKGHAETQPSAAQVIGGAWGDSPEHGVKLGAEPLVTDAHIPLGGRDAPMSGRCLDCER